MSKQTTCQNATLTRSITKFKEKLWSGALVYAYLRVDVYVCVCDKLLNESAGGDLQYRRYF